MQHSTACDAAQTAALAWAALWPRHCTHCYGSGVVAWMEDVAGDGGPRMPMSESCEHCVGMLHCPRCAAVLDFFDDDNEGVPPCRACGWAGPDDGGPQPPQSEPYCCTVAWPEGA